MDDSNPTNEEPQWFIGSAIGTSFATAQMAGFTALYIEKQIRENSTLPTPEGLRDAILPVPDTSEENGIIDMCLMLFGLDSCPDLIVSDVTFDSSCNAEFIITNIGNTDIVDIFSFTASPFYIPAWGPGPKTGWSAGIFGLPAGEPTTHRWPNLTVFGPTINISVDPQNLIEESTDANNQRSFDVPHHCQYVPVPDDTPLPRVGLFNQAPTQNKIQAASITNSLESCTNLSSMIDTEAGDYISGEGCVRNTILESDSVNNLSASKGSTENHQLYLPTILNLQQ